ncbi:cell wall-active antibiotics response protein LiaF [Paenibacillus sp. Z6-24]
MNRYMFRKTFWGLSLIGVGIVFLLNRMNMIEWGLSDVLFLLWPLILLEIGLNELLFKCKKDIGGWIMTILGGYFLGRNLGFYDYSIGEMIRFLLPVFLVAAGLKILFSKKEKRRRHQDQHQPPETPEPSYSAPPPPPASSPLDDLFNEKMGTQTPPNEEPRQGFGQQYQEPSERAYRHDPAFQEKGPYEQSTPPPASYYDYPSTGDWKKDKRQFKRQFKQKIRQQMNGDHQNKQWHHEQWKQYHKGRSCRSRRGHAEHRSGFIGDVHIGKEYFELKPLNISHFIGDTMLDLTRAQIPYGVTPVTISAFIGDVKVFIPSGVEVAFKAEGNSFIGDMNILSDMTEGFMNHINSKTIDFESVGKRVEITVSVFIGDIVISRVG